MHKEVISFLKVSTWSYVAEGEIENLGLEIKWVTLDEAIKIFENDKPEDYTAKFIQMRDLEFLKEEFSKLKQLIAKL